MQGEKCSKNNFPENICSAWENIVMWLVLNTLVLMKSVGYSLT